MECGASASLHALEGIGGLLARRECLSGLSGSDAGLEVRELTLQFVALGIPLGLLFLEGTDFLSEAIPFVEATDGESNSHRSYDADDAEGGDGYRAFGYARHREIPEAIAEDGDDEADECSRQRHPEIGLEEAATHKTRCEDEVVEVEDHDQIEVREPRRVVESGIGEDRHLGRPLHGRNEGL